MRSSRARALLVLSAAVGGLCWLALAPHADLSSAPPSDRASPDVWQWGTPRGDGAAGHPTAPSPAERAQQRVFEQGSLAGTEPAGDWCVLDAQLQPCGALRERFDHYLLGQGEVDLAALRALVHRDATRAHGAALAAQIIDLWDRYAQLRQQMPQVRFDAQDRSTWTALLAEQRGVRRRLLGDAWARAFYAVEEHDFEALQARLEAGQPPPTDPGAPVSAVPEERVARYGAAGAARLDAADAAWADWQRRLIAARATWTQLQQAPELSSLAREQTMGRYLSANFRPEEMARVRALLRL